MSDKKNKIGIIYSKMFDDFLDGLNDQDKADIIKKAIEDFADGFTDLDPRDCQHFENREKVAIDTANVVVYYDINGNDWTMISGMVVQLRAA